MKQSLEDRVQNLAKETMDVWQSKLGMITACYLPDGSAIEKLMHVAFKILEENCDCIVNPHQDVNDAKSWAAFHRGTVVVVNELPIEGTKYTADAWAYRLGAIGKGVIVEFDGHDFHERTKEQAEHDKKRDRKLTSLGYQILRFTGREVWRDPMACAMEAIELAASAELKPLPGQKDVRQVLQPVSKESGEARRGESVEANAV